MIKSDLIKVLNKSKLALDKVASTLGADAIVSKNGKVYTTNERIAIITKLPEPLSFSVKGETLLDAVKSFKSDDISFTITDKDVTLKGGNARVRMNQCDEEISTRISSIHPDPDRWKPLVKEYLTALDLAAVPTTDKKLNGVYIDGEYFWSTDGWQINRVLVDGQFDPIWVSQKNVDDIVSFGVLSKYTTENSWLHLSDDDTMLSCRKLDHTSYPIETLRNTINKFEDADTVIITDTATIFDLWESVKASIALTDSGKVDVNIVDGEIFVESHCATGEYSNVISVDIESMIKYTVFSKRMLSILAKPGIGKIGFASANGKKAFWAMGIVNEVEWYSILSAE